MWAGRVRLPGSRDVRAGYGWVVARDPRGTRTIAIGGGTDFGYTSDVRLIADRHLVLVVLSGTSRYPAAAVAQDALGALGR